MFILGIHQAHNATAAILENGKIIAAASEERFTRKKNQFGLPINAIDYCLRCCNITPSEVDLVVIAGSTWPNYLASLETTGNNHSVLYSLLSILRNVHQKTHLSLLFLEYKFTFLKGTDGFFNKIVFRLISLIFYPKIMNLLVEEFNFDKEKIIVVDHHQAHAYAALYGSPYPQQKKSVLVLTNDGGGDGLSSTISLYKNGYLRKVVQTTDQNSLGAFFAGITQFMGMRPLEDEYKIMGLAPYAAEEGVDRVYQVIKKYISVDPKTLCFINKYAPDTLIYVFPKELSRFRFDWIAGAAQKLVEDLMFEWIKAAVKKYKINTIVCGGGVFMNVKANLKISELPEVKEMYVFPSSGDESTAIGACYFGFLNKMGKKNIPEPIRDLYLGPQFSDEEIKGFIDKKNDKKYLVRYCPNIEEVTAKLLASGKIVARLNGRMEWGARALGNRSILADASKEGVVEEINKMIKKRDFWMPFAPSILKEEVKKYIENPKNIHAPFMNCAFHANPKTYHDLMGATHPYDKTLRPQIVDKETNPLYHKLISEYKKITGRGGILNTSFNIHGDPIVCSPKDALDAFERSDLKYLSLGNYLISKKH
ncbi:MAG: carbamoyltransferase C-terminal domain-containing protein [bacterium]|nr:carbamoyltransferase C-terminal domain-containing protein [bacterium]